MQFERLINSWSTFEATILSLVTELGLSELDLECDHVSLRVNSVAAADALRQDFRMLGDIISDKSINGRPILIFRLHKPLTLGPLLIPCVELPYPGNKTYPSEGWEHIELVLPCNASNCDALSEALCKVQPTMAAVLDGHSHFQVKASSPAGDAERLPNPTLAFSHQGLTVKVHPHSIEAIIASERSGT